MTRFKKIKSSLPLRAILGGQNSESERILHCPKCGGSEIDVLGVHIEQRRRTVIVVPDGVYQHEKSRFRNSLKGGVYVHFQCGRGHSFNYGVDLHRHFVSVSLDCVNSNHPVPTGF